MLQGVGALIKDRWLSKLLTLRIVPVECAMAGRVAGVSCNSFPQNNKNGHLGYWILGAAP
jgi:hypothetical protein